MSIYDLNKSHTYSCI